MIAIRILVVTTILALAAGAAGAQSEAGPTHRVLVELFTSQG